MFVTANLIDPAGQPLIKVDDENVIVPEPSPTGAEHETVLGEPSTPPMPR
jgi:hypothetical protein